jgi:hypothetical protein
MVMFEQGAQEIGETFLLIELSSQRRHTRTLLALLAMGL